VNLADRFWAKVDRRGPGECWLWTGSVNPKGYGSIRVGSRTDGTRSTVSVHRLAYQLANGGIPEGEGYHGICVLHQCDTPRCCNPNHLFLGTQADNVADRETKGRGHWVASKGEAHGRSKLSARDVLVIRAESTRGVAGRTLAGRHGVSTALVSLIINRKVWQHI
jgi:hypothetical protein